MADDEGSWVDDIPFGIEGYTGPVDGALGELEDLGLGPPDTWTDFDIYIGDDSVDFEIIDASGEVYEYSVEGDPTETDWDWVFDIWDWLGDEYPDVDKDSHYGGE